MSKDEQIFKLYRLLDDIDTLDDAVKDNDKAFREHTRTVQQKRHEIVPDTQADDLYATYFGDRTNATPESKLVHDLPQDNEPLRKYSKTVVELFDADKTYPYGSTDRVKLYESMCELLEAEQTRLKAELIAKLRAEINGWLEVPSVTMEAKNFDKGIRQALAALDTLERGA